MNAKEEYIRHVTNKPAVKCAKIQIDNWEEQYNCPTFYLKTNGNLKEFLDNINVNYDNGYGGQNLYGFIWYEDGSWSKRGEYDGSEWWEHMTLPIIPKECL